MIKFYNAGAGSGKTHTLSEELADFLIVGNGKPSQVILTTFSKKSAEELKERIRKTLLEKGQPDKAAEMSNALIGTVNAVCSQLVGKYAMEAGFSPELRVLDEASMKTFFNEFINGVIDDDSFQQLQFLCNKFSLFERDEEGAFRQKNSLKPDWPNIVKNLAARFRAYDFNEEDVERSKQETIKCAQEFFITNQFFTCKSIWEVIENSKNELLNGNLAKKDEPAIGGLDRLRNCISNQHKVCWADFAKAGSEIAINTMNNNAWFDEVVLLCRQYHRTPEFANEYIQFIKLVYDTAYKLIDGYQNYKQERGLIDFADQELLFLEMIKNNPVIQAEIKATFKLVMVDEFQDSSPVQLSIFTCLQKIVEDAIWVGDPKQAIYGFRDSDTELFNLALRAVKENDAAVTKSLTQSFRSRPGIINAVNEIFTDIFKGILEEEHIVLGPSDKVTEVDGIPNGYTAPALQVQFYNETRVEGYYAGIGAYVKEVLRSGVQVYDKKNDAFRNIRGNDIALLFRTNPAIKKAAYELKKQGISVSCEAEGLQDQAETLWLSCLLRLLINVDDSLAVSNLMLLEKAVQDVDSLLTTRLNFIETEPGELKDESWLENSPVATEIIKQQQLLAQMPLIQAISHLISISELPRYCAQWGNSSQRMANINKLIEMAGAYEEQCAIMGLAAGFAGYLTYISEIDALPASESEEAVTLMTVHKAKGLEWPMVIIVKLEVPDHDCRVLFNTIHVKQPHQPDYNNLLFGQTIVYLPWPFGDTQKIVKVSDDLIENRKKLDSKLCAFERFQEEEDRLLYVALTRVRDFLILPYYKKSSGSCIESPSRKNSPGLFSAAHWEKLRDIATVIPKVIDLDGHKMLVQCFPTQTRTDAEIETGQVVHFYDHGQPSNVAIHGAIHDNRFVSPSKLQCGLTDSTIQLLPYNQPLLSLNNLKDYAVLGTAIHNAFASWTYHNDKPQRINLITDLMHRMQLNGHINATELDLRFEKFWDFIQTTYSPRHVVREIPLTEVKENNGAVTNGIADLILQTNKGLVLIDHKSFPGHFENMAMNPEHDQYAGKYGGQLNMYKQLIEKATGQKVIAMLLHYVVQGRIVEVA